MYTRNVALTLGINKFDLLFAHDRALSTRPCNLTVIELMIHNNILKPELWPFVSNHTLSSLCS